MVSPLARGGRNPMRDSCYAACLLWLFAGAAVCAEREPIGTVLGETVCRDQVEAEEPAALAGRLRQVFLQPVMQQYRGAHAAELTPSGDELAEAHAYFVAQHAKRMSGPGGQGPKLRMELAAIQTWLGSDEVDADTRRRLELRQRSLESRLAPPGEAVAGFVVGGWKWNAYLHKNYGGGRVLFQQAGLEAFDATRRWLEERERAGDFAITDDGLRDAFYAYWTTQDHGAFLSDDPEQVAALTTPYWARGSAPSP